MEQAALELRWLRVREERAVVAVEVDAESCHLAVLVEREVAGHVVVARKRGRDEVLGAVLDPLDRPPEQETCSGRDDIARIDGYLVAEAAPDVGRDDPD